MKTEAYLFAGVAGFFLVTDIVYISFASPAAKDRAPKILESNAWKKLSANRDNRVFAVNNEVWQTGEGIVAARGMLADLKWVNAPIN